MDELCRYANRPVSFIGRYLRRRQVAHLAILVAVVGAVSCSVATQYGVKFLIDTLAQGPKASSIIAPFAVLAILISRQSFVAARLLDRQLHFRCRQRRFAPRAVSPSDRPRPQLFFEQVAGNIDEPDHGHLKRRLHY